MKPSDALRKLPSLDRLLQKSDAKVLLHAAGHELTVKALREVLDQARQNITRQAESTPTDEQLIASAQNLIATWVSPSLIPVINASGILLHTNLGRAPLSMAALKAIEKTALGYSNLEFDLNSGKRGSRLIHAESMLKHLLGVEAAVVVNNNAGAVLLALSALARGKKVAISRSQLVEIGGGFRIPDVMRQSGAHLLEIGTTNRVHMRDYEEAAQSGASLVMCAHASNFKIIGFTTEPTIAEITSVTKTHRIPLLYDIGSGALLDTARYGLAHEPTVQEALADGADLVCFSGDKLLGGPQAGIVVGKGNLIERLKKHPLARALRADKLCLSALQATLQSYLRGQAEQEIPLWRMISTDMEELRARADKWQQQIGMGDVIAGQSMVGGGSLPGETLPTMLLALDFPSADKFLARLRAFVPPVIARVESKRILFDVRTVLPEQDETLISILRTLTQRKKI